MPWGDGLRFIPPEIRDWTVLAQVLLFCLAQAGRVEGFQKVVRDPRRESMGGHGGNSNIDWQGMAGPYAYLFEDGKLTHVTYKATNETKPGPQDMCITLAGGWGLVSPFSDCDARVSKGKLEWFAHEAFYQNCRRGFLGV